MALSATDVTEMRHRSKIVITQGVKHPRGLQSGVTAHAGVERLGVRWFMRRVIKRRAPELTHESVLRTFANHRRQMLPYSCMFWSFSQQDHVSQRLRMITSKKVASLGDREAALMVLVEQPEGAKCPEQP